VRCVRSFEDEDEELVALTTAERSIVERRRIEWGVLDERRRG